MAFYFWEGADVRLRAPEPTDWETFLRWSEDADLMGALDDLQFPQSKEHARDWAQKKSMERPTNDEFFFVIETLAENALQMAVARRRPSAGFLHHSDRGSQYTSRAYRLRLEQSGMIASMSRKGNCWDNAPTESFFGTLKEECVGSTVYSSHEEARLALFTYLEVYYNRVRRHSTLGYLSPLVYEQRFLQQAMKNV